MARLLALVALVVVGTANARISEKLSEKSVRLQGAFLGHNQYDGQEGPWMCPGGKDDTCEKKCNIYMHAFSAYCFTHIDESPAMTMGQDLKDACAFLQSWMLMQPAFQAHDFCHDICEIDLSKDLNVENNYLKPVKQFWVDFDGVERDALRIEQYSAFGSILCCSNLVDGCLSPPVCTHPAHGGWTLLLNKDGNKTDTEVPHRVQCGDRNQTINYHDAVEILIPLNKKVLCYADCLVIPIKPVCDHLNAVYDW